MLDSRPATAPELERRNQTLALLTSSPVQDLLSNADGTRIRIVETLQGRVPLLVCDQSQRAANVSAISHYIDYPAEHFAKNGRRLLYAAASLGRRFATATSLDRIVWVNHWLFVAGPRLLVDSTDLEQFLADLCRDYPHHAIGFRGLIEGVDSQLVHALRELGASGLRARTIYLFDPRTDLSGGTNRRIRLRLNRDARELARSRTRQLTHDQLIGRVEELHELYRALYLHKHSKTLNPQYTARFIEFLLASPSIEVTAWTESETPSIACFAAHLLPEDSDLTSDGLQTIRWSIAGCRPSSGDELRKAFALDVAHARERDLVFNWSAGNDAFKRRRGAIAAQEVDLVFTRHLSRQRRAPWKALSMLRPLHPLDAGRARPTQ